MKKEKWDLEYIDKFSKEKSEATHPLDWRRFAYYFNLYIGEGEVKIKVKNGAMLIERVK